MEEIQTTPKKLEFGPEAFALLEEEAASDETRDRLLKPTRVRCFATMKRHDPARAGRLVEKLKGWPLKGELLLQAKQLTARSDNLEKQERAKKAVARATDAGRAAINEDQPLSMADAYIERARPNLIHVDGAYLDYSCGAYRPLEKLTVRAEMQRLLASSVDSSGQDFHPSRRILDDAMDALTNKVHRASDDFAPPVWLTREEGDPDPRKLIVGRNGILNVETGRLSDHTPRLFTRNALPFDIEPDPIWEPVEWLKFLESVWPEAEGGRENWDALQEMIGLLLVPETRYQKIWMVVGPRRSGKGTIAEVILGLLGPANVASQSATKLGEQFGLKQLIGKLVMLVPDLRLGRNANIGGITENLLSISGQDRLSISRKFQDDWSGRLDARIVIMTNKNLILPDQSGALAARYVPLVMTKSFAGREDFELKDRLLTELPEILNWAVAGLRRMEERRDPKTGRPTGPRQTTTGLELLKSIVRRGSAVKAFLDECCVVEPGEAILKGELFGAFVGWTKDNDLVRSIHTLTDFAEELETASGNAITKGRSRKLSKDGKTPHAYLGVTLKPEMRDRWANYEEGEDF